MITKETIEALVRSSRDECVMLSPLDVAFNYRFFNLSLPRRSGKTTTLNAIAKGKSALKLRSCLNYDDPSWKPLSNVSRVIDGMRGLRFNNLKYSHIVIDEFNDAHMDNLKEMLCFLLVHQLLTEDYVIIALGTRY